MKPLIGIVIPYYKTWEKFEDYLYTAMKNAENITTFRLYRIEGPFIEKDGTPEAWVKMAALVGKLRNDGIQQAIDDNCDYVAFLDDDDLIPSDYFNKMLMYNHELVKTAIHMSVKGDTWFADDKCHRYEEDMTFKHVYMGSPPMFVAIEVLKDLGRPWYGESAANEDFSFWRRLHEKGYKIWVADLIVREYR